MKSINILDEISDGKLYDIEDIVKADTCGCDGCSDCCHDVGELVVLTPFDIYEIVNYLGVEFDELLGDKIELRQNNKILLPYLKMQDKDKRCSFLNKENRCMIHSKRPNICRLFPLGRAYQDDDFKYFLQVGNCPKEDLKDVKVKSWIGIENYDENKRFILEWYKFIKALTFRLKFVRDEEEIKAINKILLDGCYRIKIKEDEDFYSCLLYTSGNALLPEHHEEDMDMICEVGATTIRLAHYQHDQYFYDLCDERGMVIWAEIPYISTHMPNGRENTISQMKELITQNYNHPSIVVWGLSNEITMSGESTEDLRENHVILNDLAHEMDKTRLTTIACVSMCSMDDPYVQIPDVVSYNHYFGWYGGTHL